jgi:hypothetical protein
MAEIGDVLVVAPDKLQRHGSCHNNKQHLIFKQISKENDGRRI